MAENRALADTSGFRGARERRQATRQITIYNRRRLVRRDGQEYGWTMRVRIDREKCVRAENCVLTAPTVFAIDADGKARLVDPRSVGDDALLLAAELCPTEAIVIESDEGEQLYP